MAAKHIHKIGVIVRLMYRCAECKKVFACDDAASYIECTMGYREGLDHWRNLRDMHDRMKIAFRKGERFVGPDIEEKTFMVGDF